MVDAKVQVETPLALVDEHNPKELLEPEAVNVGTMPETGFELASNKVIVRVDVSTPSGRTGPVPEIVPVAGFPGVNTTLEPTLLIGVNMEIIFVSACVDFKVQLATPLALVGEQIP